jgi:hypothetical protein
LLQGFAVLFLDFSVNFLSFQETSCLPPP